MVVHVEHNIELRNKYHTRCEFNAGCKFNDFEVRLSMYKQPSAPTIKEAPAEAPAEEAAVEDEGGQPHALSLFI